MYSNKRVTSPEVIDALPNQLLDPLVVLSSSVNQILHLLQLLLQLADALVADARVPPAPLAGLQDLVGAAADLRQVGLDLLDHHVPQVEAGVAGHTLREHARVAAGTLVAAPARHALPARTRPALPVALGCVRALWVAAALWEGERQEKDRRLQTDPDTVA